MSIKLFVEAKKARDALLQEHVHPAIIELDSSPRPLTTVEWAYFKSKGLNSFERQILLPLIPLPCLIAEIKHYLSNVTTPCPHRAHFGPMPSTYEEALLHVLLPTLIHQLENHSTQLSSPNPPT